MGGSIFYKRDRGLIVLPELTGVVLDPSSPDGTTTTKVGFDCTKPVGSAFAERLAVPSEVLEKIGLGKLLSREKWERIPVEPWGKTRAVSCQP